MQESPIRGHTTLRKVKSTSGYTNRANRPM